MNEREVREYVHKLRRFYTDVLIYGVVNLGLILIWAISGGGYFWPIWVIIGWGIGLGVHAFSLGLIPQMNAMVPFMTAEWEDQEVRRLMEAGHKENGKEEKKTEVKTDGPSKVKKVSPKKAPPKKPAPPKKG
ncbi:MAG: 2TM domain-containing protein [Proteobacteria bacterium]|nr:2TM domain-containing protein [Pseudomonadota bacterium]